VIVRVLAGLPSQRADAQASASSVSCTIDVEPEEP
jgi:hypothetical protein